MTFPILSTILYLGVALLKFCCCGTPPRATCFSIYKLSVKKYLFLKLFWLILSFSTLKCKKKNTSNIFLYIIYERHVLKRHLADATRTTNKRFVDTHHQTSFVNINHMSLISRVIFRFTLNTLAVDLWKIVNNRIT